MISKLFFIIFVPNLFRFNAMAKRFISLFIFDFPLCLNLLYDKASLILENAPSA